MAKPEKESAEREQVDAMGDRTMGSAAVLWEVRAASTHKDYIKDVIPNTSDGWSAVCLGSYFGNARITWRVLMGL
jgi:hypothetical protein